MAAEANLERLMTGPGTSVANLPSEIRVKIYEYALDFQFFEPFGRRSGSSTPHETTVSQLLPALAFLNAQLQSEAEQVLYSRNTIVLTFGQFLHMVKQETYLQSSPRIAWIQNLIVIFSDYDYLSYVGLSQGPFTAAELLKKKVRCCYTSLSN